MQLVEQHVISKDDHRYLLIDNAAHAASNLRNFANRLVYEGLWFGELSDEPMKRYEAPESTMLWPSKEIYHAIKTSEEYTALPRKVSSAILQQLGKDWKGYWKARKEYRKDPSKFLGKPKAPRFQDHDQGRSMLIYDIQAIHKPPLERGIIKPSQLGIEIPTKHPNLDQVRIVPRHGFYMVEVVYPQEPREATGDPALYAGIDIGVDNLAAIVSNKADFVPRIVSGGLLKSINLHYNECKADLHRRLPEGRHSSARLEKLTNQRTRKIMAYLHTASRQIIDMLIAEKIETLVIGKVAHWKQEKRKEEVGPNFVPIPHARFVDLLMYKAELVGIKVILVDESYTSLCSFLDDEDVCAHDVYQGQRITGRLFKSAAGTIINADVNAALNIIKIAAPDAFGQGARGYQVMNPSQLSVRLS